MSDHLDGSAITGAGEHRPPGAPVSAETAAPGARELVSRREFARRKGWAPSYVVKLTQLGTLSLSAACPACDHLVNSRAQACDHCGASLAGVDWKRGRIDPQLAERELRDARDPDKDATRDRHATHRTEASPPGDRGADRASGGEKETAGDLFDASGSSDPAGTAELDLERATYAQARTQRERLEAQLKQLQLEEQQGKLVRADVVQQQQLAIARLVRDTLLALPPRVQHALAVERDPLRVGAKLEEEIRALLEKLSAQIGSGQL